MATYRSKAEGGRGGNFAKSVEAPAGDYLAEIIASKVQPNPKAVGTDRLVVDCVDVHSSAQIITLFMPLQGDKSWSTKQVLVEIGVAKDEGDEFEFDPDHMVGTKFVLHLKEPSGGYSQRDYKRGKGGVSHFEKWHDAAEVASIKAAVAAKPPF